MRLLTESNIINALHKRHMEELNEELQDSVRHQSVPYHEDVDTDIVPDNVEGTEDDSNSWLDKSFAYQCPQCDGYFVSPEQLGDDEDVDCPYCGKMIVPDAIDDFDADEFEVEDGEDVDFEDDEDDDEDDDDDEDEDDDEDDDDNFEEDDEEDDEDDEDDDDKDDDEDIDEGKVMVRNGKRLSGSLVRVKLKNKKLINKKPPKPGYRRKLNKQTGSIDYVKVGISDMRRAGKMAHKGGANAKRAKSMKKRGLNNSFELEPRFYDMEESSVMAVMNKAIAEAFTHAEECIPFKITDITEAVYYEDSDRLDLTTDILYKDGETDVAEFSLSGLSEGDVTVTENTDKLDIPKVKIVGKGAVVNESIYIN